MSEHLAHQVILVRPVNFGFNPETAVSNAFQQAAGNAADPFAIQNKALEEFTALAAALTGAGIDVLIFDDTPEPRTPDSIFPNNWFSTHSDGALCLYPMMAENRRAERRAGIVETLREKFDVRRTLDLTERENEGQFLEGTGSLVLDHKERVAYGCLSPRTDKELFLNWARRMNFADVSFSAFDAAGRAIYHTNVLMCIGDSFAVVCLESVTSDEERSLLRKTIERTGKEIVGISRGQMNDFAGNMLLLQNKAGEHFLFMSRRAFDSLNKGQITTLSKYARLVPVDISTIETCGGGSVRCMIAENFLTAK